MLKKLTEQFNQTIASYEPALKEWGEQEYTYQIDIQTAKEKRDSVADALKEHQELHSTTPAEGEEELPSINECGKCKKLTGKLEKAKEEVLTAQETYTQKKSEFQAVESTVNQITANYQQQLASIKSSAGAAASGVAQAKGGVAQAEAQVDAAEDARHGATLAQIEQGIGTARRGVDSAEVQKDVAKAQREAAEQAAEMAKLQQEAAKNSIEQQIDSLKDSLVGSQISAQSNQAQEIAIQKMQNTLEDATITAPVSGVVTAVYAKVGEPGNGLLFVVEDTESLKIKTRIKEYDIANVQVGMPVIIKSDATGDKEISGTITYIAPAAVKTEAGTTKTTDGNSTVEFEAEVQVNEKNSGLRIGMNTRLTVMLEEKQNVIGVPYESIVEKADGSSVVYTVTQKGSEGKDAKTYVVTEVPVTTGLETDFYVEVSGNGVSDGMAVLTDPQSVAPGAEVTPDFVNGGDAVVGMSQGE